MKAERPPGTKVGERVYWPNCSICQMMKKNRDYRRRINNSTYFIPTGRESLSQINTAFGDPFAMGTMYQHLRRHQAKQRITLARQFDQDGVALTAAIGSTIKVIEADSASSTTNHEMGLDDFIREGRMKLAKGELQITASTFLQAIKINADNEKGNKDRRLEALKTMFKGAAPAKKEIE